MPLLVLWSGEVCNTRKNDQNKTNLHNMDIIGTLESQLRYSYGLSSTTVLISRFGSTLYVQTPNVRGIQPRTGLGHKIAESSRRFSLKCGLASVLKLRDRILL